MPFLAIRPEEEPREGELEPEGELILGEEPTLLEPEEKLGVERVEGGLEKPGLLEGEEDRGAEKIDRGAGEEKEPLREGDDSNRGEEGTVNVQGLSWYSERVLPLRAEELHSRIRVAPGPGVSRRGSLDRLSQELAPNLERLESGE